ncbi:Hypp1941 [Branchiostoma lanceolatum]|uniref:Hypp1941 protein n=1 Tax=Branchiostoma lanceolatum TaxID=7740 RepID=A0A8J9ZM56_BRALA|nr:Hypp1941 [Branchiostoma lanceolatum]
MKDKNGKIRHRLAEDIINDQVGGAGWMYLDIALQVDKYSPKTVLVKTRKCDSQGKIVLEPKAREKTSNYLVPKGAAKGLDGVSIQAYPKKVHLKQTYSYERSVSGNVSLNAAETVGFSAEDNKTNKRRVETTCTDLEHKSVDIEDLKNALSVLTAQTSAEGIRNETSFLVVTDVLVAREVSIVETHDSKKSRNINVDAKNQGVGIEAGGGTTKETAANLERINPSGTILAIKLARVHYDERGTIERDGVLADGTYDGNYTLGFGNMDREGHYTVTTLARPIGVKMDKFEINVSLLGRQNYTEVKVPQDVCETGLHRIRKSFPTGPKLLPLKGIQVFKSTKNRYFLARAMKRLVSSKAEREVNLSKVLVTDLEHDQTYICPCSEETAVTDRRLWFDCKQWRERVAGQEFLVTYMGKTYSVSEEDPIVRIFGDREFDDGLDEIKWSNAEVGNEGRDIVHAADTFKDYGIKANAVIELLPRGQFIMRGCGVSAESMWEEEETSSSSSSFMSLFAECELELTLIFEACQVTLCVGEDERIDTLPEKVLSLLEVYHGDQKVTDVRQKLKDLGPSPLIEKDSGEDTAEEANLKYPNELVFKMQDVAPDTTGFGIQVTLPASKFKITDDEFGSIGDIIRRLHRVYARMNVVYDGRVMTNQTYRQLKVQAAAHVQLQLCDPDNAPVVPSRNEAKEIEMAIESLIQELQA